MDSYEPLYRRVADRTLETVSGGFSKPYVRAGVGLGAATLAAILLTPNEAYAAQDAVQQTVERYGFFSGLLDGIFLPVNFIMSAFSENTWARDGTGIASEPANFLYNAGYLMAVLGVFGGGSVASSSTKKKSE